MNKILFVEYLPHGAKSRTLFLKEAFLNSLQDSAVTYLNLVEDAPEFFNEERMSNYVKRNYNLESLSSSESASLAKIDDAVKAFKNHDTIVLCCPVHNFGFPAAVKAWIDNVIIVGETFGKDSQNQPIAFPDKKMLLLYTSGGDYPKDKATAEYPYWGTMAVHFNILTNFLGVKDAAVISAATSNPTTKDEQETNAINQAEKLVFDWAL